MKRLFALFLMVSVLAVFALPVLAAAPLGGPVDPTDTFRKLPTNPPATTGEGLLDLADTVTNWVFAVFVVLTVIMILLAAFQFVTAGGEPEKVGEARQKLIWAAVGIIIALASKGIVPIIRTIVGV